MPPFSHLFEELNKATVDYEKLVHFLSSKRKEINGSHEPPEWARLVLSEKESKSFRKAYREYCVVRDMLSEKDADEIHSCLINIQQLGWQKTTKSLRSSKVRAFLREWDGGVISNLGSSGQLEARIRERAAFDLAKRSKILSLAREIVQQKEQQLKAIQDLIQKRIEESVHLELVNLWGQEVSKKNVIHSNIKKIRQNISVILSQGKEMIVDLSRRLISPLDKIKLLLREDSYTGSDFEGLITLAQTLQLDKPDIELTKKWVGRNVTNPNWHRYAMESARAAELVALHIYRTLYGDATDISILQLPNSEPGSWQLADIQLANDHLIDVKNARRSLHTNNSYSEHCVPSLKRDRKGDNVTISGMLSPYEKDGKLGGDVVWMGETSFKFLEQIQKQFSSPFLDVDFTKFKHGLKFFMPPWSFDYPEIYYKKRNTNISFLKALNYDAMRPVFSELKPTIPICILAGWDHLEDFAPACQAEAKHLLKRFNDVRNLRRPILFMHVLSRFVDCMHKNRSFPASEIKECIYFSFDGKKECPLGIKDPLAVISDLINLLAEVDSLHIDKGIRGYKYFRLGNPHIFQGKKEREGRYKTIYAYCGGRHLITNASCGTNPIYMGMNSIEMHCRECDKLVCVHCGFCSRDCTAFPERRERMTGGRIN